MKNLTFTICRELDLPAEIELEVNCKLSSGHNGYFNHHTGDCDPPQNATVEVNNKALLIAQMEQLFDHYKQENVKQLERYLESVELAEKAEEESASYEEAA